LGFENLAASKEAFFRLGLQRKIELIFAFFKILDLKDLDIDITFDRNLPEDIKAQVEIASQIKNSMLKVSDKTILKLLSFIDDIEAELEAYKEEKEEEEAQFDIDEMDIEEEDEQEDNAG
jgi:SPP1 family phage portal protein